MKEGYYWARGKYRDTWGVVQVELGNVFIIGDDDSYREKDFEFVGEKLERPMTDSEIEAMEE